MKVSYTHNGVAFERNVSFKYDGACDPTYAAGKKIMVRHSAKIPSLMQIISILNLWVT